MESILGLLKSLKIRALLAQPHSQSLNKYFWKGISSPPAPPDVIRSISTPLWIKEILAYRCSGRGWRGWWGRDISRLILTKILKALFINYVSSCQTHKSRTWEWGAAIGFPGIHILMLGTVWRGSSKWDTSGCILIEQYKCRLGTPLEMCTINLKGHGNEADFHGFCINQFSIGPLHYISSRSYFGFEFAEIFIIEKRLTDFPHRFTEL